MSSSFQDRKLLWNGKTLAMVTFVVVVVITLIVIFTSNRNYYDELEITLAVIALGFFLFLAFGLYKGINVIGKPIFPKLKIVDVSFVKYYLDLIDFDIGDGIFGVIASIVLSIVITVILFALLTLLVSIIWAAFLILVFLLYYFFFRAMRLVFIKSSVCKGNLILSLRFSFLYTALYTGWILVIFMVGKHLHLSLH